MADSNAPEHTDRGLFGLFGKKEEEKKQGEQPHTVDPHAGHAPAYAGEVHHAPPPAASHQPQHYGQGAGGNAYAGEVHPVPPPAVSHEPQGEDGKRHQGLKGKLHRSNSSSSSSSSDEDEGGRKKEGRKKKGIKDKIKEKLPGHQGEKEPKEEGDKKGLMDKIKEKLPGHHEGEKGH